MPFAPSDLGVRLAGWLRNDDLGAAGTRLSSSSTWNAPASAGALMPFWLPLTGTGGGPMILDNRTPAGGKALYIPLAEAHSAMLANLMMNSPSVYLPWMSAVVNGDYDGFGPWGLANGALNTNQCQSTGIPATYAMKMLTPSAVTSYTLYRQTANPSYMPSAWTFAGSNDGTTWTTLDTQTAQSFAVAASQVYSFSNPTSYAYYRLVVTATNGGPQVVISEIELNATPNAALVWSECEVFFVLRSMNGAADTPRAWEFGSSASQKHYFYQATTHYEDFGSATRVNYNPTANLTGWHLLNMRAIDAGGGNTTFTSIINGVLQFTSAAAAKGWKNNPSTYALNVEMAEMVITRGALTALERARVVGYLSGRHGLSISGGAFIEDTFPGASFSPSVVSRSVSSIGDTTGYTTQASEPLTVAVDKTGWCTWTCPVNGTYKFDTAGSAFSASIAVYTGSALGSLVLVGSGTGGSPATVVCTAGTTYRIQIGKTTGITPDTGAVSLTISGTYGAAQPSLFPFQAAQANPALLLKGRTTKALDAAAGG